LIDCAGHLFGRLASILAKELLNGQKIICVRTEEIQISGSLFRNKLIFSKFIQKRCNTNPRRGPYHFRAPSRILWRTIRGMIPHKTKRGQVALERLKAFEGVPHPYDKMKRMVLPNALRVLRLKPGRKFCRLGDLASAYGWSHDDLIKKLEDKRKTKSAEYYAKKKQYDKLKAMAIANLGDKLTPFTVQIPAPNAEPLIKRRASSKSAKAKPEKKGKEQKQPKPKPKTDKVKETKDTKGEKPQKGGKGEKPEKSETGDEKKGR